MNAYVVIAAFAMLGFRSQIDERKSVMLGENDAIESKVTSTSALSARVSLVLVIMNSICGLTFRFSEAPSEYRAISCSIGSSEGLVEIFAVTFILSVAPKEASAVVRTPGRSFRQFLFKLGGRPCDLRGVS